MKKFKNDKVDEDSADKVATTTTNSSTPTGDGSSLPRALMTVKRSLESIPIKEIKRFELIPDFVTLNISRTSNYCQNTVGKFMYRWVEFD